MSDLDNHPINPDTLTEDMCVSAGPGLTLHTDEGWLLLEELEDAYVSSLRQFLGKAGIKLEPWGEKATAPLWSAWSYNVSEKKLVLAIDRFLDTTAWGYLAERHSASAYTWVVALPGSKVKDRTPKPSVKGDTVNKEPQECCSSWPSIVLDPCPVSGVDIQVSPSIEDDIFRLLTMRGYTLTSRQPGTGLTEISQRVRYHTEASLMDLRHALTEYYLLRYDRWTSRPPPTYIKNVYRPDEWTHFIITEEF
jgi:hypothetical protein